MHEYHRQECVKHDILAAGAVVATGGVGAGCICVSRPCTHPIDRSGSSCILHRMCHERRGPRRAPHQRKPRCPSGPRARRRARTPVGPRPRKPAGTPLLHRSTRICGPRVRHVAAARDRPTIRRRRVQLHRRRSADCRPRKKDFSARSRALHSSSGWGPNSRSQRAHRARCR
jgi:hypothetical protein